MSIFILVSAINKFGRILGTDSLETICHLISVPCQQKVVRNLNTLVLFQARCLQLRLILINKNSWRPGYCNDSSWCIPFQF